MSDEKERWIEPELVQELSETVSTLTRLGVTLAGIPLGMLPRERQLQAKQLTGELLRFGSAVPRTLGNVMAEVAEEWEKGEKPREDLGTRLRREQQMAARQQQGAAPAGGAVEQVEENIQETWETTPTVPDEPV